VGAKERQGPSVGAEDRQWASAGGRARDRAQTGNAQRKEPFAYASGRWGGAGAQML